MNQTQSLPFRGSQCNGRDDHRPVMSDVQSTSGPEADGRGGRVKLHVGISQDDMRRVREKKRS